MTHRTVTLPTIDHGPVTLAEPSWCAGHTDHHPRTARVDILHAGPPVDLAYLGAPLFTAQLVQSPFVTPDRPGVGGRTAGVSVHPIGRTLTPVDLVGLAAALDSYADRLRGLADLLADALAGGGR